MKLPLLVKWLAAILIVGAVPLALLAKLGLDIQRKWLEDAEKSLEAAVVDEASENVSGVLDDLEDATSDVGSDLVDRSLSDDARIALAKRAVEHASALDYVAIYDRDGKFVDAVAGGAEHREVGAPKTVDVAALRTHFGMQPITSSTESPDLFWAAPLMVDGSLVAVALGRVDPERLAARLRELSNARFARPDRVALVDDRLRRIAGGGVVERTERALGAMSSTLPAQGITKTFPFIDEDGTPMVGTLRVIPNRRLGVFVARPESEVYAAIREARRAFLVVAAGFLASAILAGVFLAKRQVAPIVDLVALTKKYGDRQFDVEPDVHTGDEIEVLASSMSEMAKTLKRSEAEISRRATVEANLSRYLPNSIAHAIATGKLARSLGGGRQDVSIVFADVAAFTSFAESADPERVVAFLNELFSVLSEVIFKHDGLVDKFLGDCVMAIFGANEENDHVDRALLAATEMQRFVEASAPMWKETYDFEVAMGIGVSTGFAVLGNLGSEVRMEYTAIGDTVNIASRLENMARPGQILVTDEVANRSKWGFRFRALGGHAVRGKRAPLEIHELISEGS